MQYGKDWFKTWFNTKYYHILYEDRNYDDAQFFIDNIINDALVWFNKRFLK